MAKAKKSVTEQKIQGPKENKKITMSMQSSVVTDAIAKLKDRSKIIQRLDKEALQNVKDEFKNHDKKKGAIVRDFAKRLEEEGRMPTNEICAHISEVFSGYIDESWVRKILDDKKYKNKAASENATIGANNRGINPAKKNKKEDAMEEPQPAGPEPNGTEPEPEEFNEEDGVQGVENVRRGIVNDDKYEVMFESQTYKIDTEKLKDYPKEVLLTMVKHLVGITEWQAGKIADLEGRLHKVMGE